MSDNGEDLSEVVASVKDGGGPDPNNYEIGNAAAYWADVARWHSHELHRLASKLSSALDRLGGCEKERGDARTVGVRLVPIIERLRYSLAEMMKAYERRIRTDCTAEQLEKRPWECAEYLAASDVLRRTDISESAAVERQTQCECGQPCAPGSDWCGKCVA